MSCPRGSRRTTRDSSRASRSRRRSAGPCSTSPCRWTTRSSTRASRPQGPLGDRQRPRGALLQGPGRRVPRRAQGGRLLLVDPLGLHRRHLRRHDAGEQGGHPQGLRGQGRQGPDPVRARPDHRRRAPPGARRDLDAGLQRGRQGDGGQLPADQPHLPDGVLGRGWQLVPDPSDRRHAWPHGQPQGRDHRASPIKANFREGLTVLDFFISTHGARKGLADTALRTADSGYLTRRLVDVSQDVIIREDDCGTDRGLKLPIAQVNEVTGTRSLSEVVEASIYARTLAEDVEVDGTVLAEAGMDLGDVVIGALYRAGVDEVRVRSVLTCDSKVGTCAKCYSRWLAVRQARRHQRAVGVVAPSIVSPHAADDAHLPHRWLRPRPTTSPRSAACRQALRGAHPQGVADRRGTAGPHRGHGQGASHPAHAGRRLRGARLPVSKRCAPARPGRSTTSRSDSSSRRDRPPAGPSHPRPAGRAKRLVDEGGACTASRTSRSTTSTSTSSCARYCARHDHRGQRRQPAPG